MTQPYFLPDPSIPDSDLLGYGDLIFNDGRTRYLSGDPETAASLPRQNVDQGPIPDIGAPPMSSDADQVSNYLTSTVPSPAPPPASHASPSLGLRRDADLTNQLDESSGMLPTVPIPGTDHALDGSGQIVQAGQADAQGGLPGVPIPGTDHALDSSGKIVPAPQAGYGTGGLQLASREGALPQDVASQQAQDRAAGNEQEQQALGMSRMAELHAYRVANAEQAGILDAKKAAQEKEVAEQQAKQKRLNDERDLINKQDIKTDLVSAEGGIGALFSILGAGLLGFVHSDAGLRMIDNTIDQNVKKQLSMRDSKLKAIADQLGSTDQAIAAGKAKLYEIAADKAQQMKDITKADVFEAQGPEIFAALKQKQLENEQKFQNASLGKTLEKAPAAAAQPKAIDVEKYGKAAQEQTQQEKNIQRAANAIGLSGWDPESGKFANREEVLKNGIPGVGKVDTFLQGVPGLRNLDTMATSKEGQKVRAALEGLVAAEAKQQNPGRAPTDADRDAARITLGLTTEEGTVAAIERLMSQQPQAKAQNTAAFGNAASTYEGRIDQMGARPPQQNGPVDMGQPLEPGKARQQLEQERARKPAEGAGPQASVSPMQDVSGEVQAVAGRELPPEGLKILVAQAAHETGDGQHAPGNNFFGIKGKGNNLETTEGEGQNARRVRSDFRAYGSPNESVQDVVSLLQRKYPTAWQALERGDAPAYVAALKDGGYFTGSETEYLNGLMRRL